MCIIERITVRDVYLSRSLSGSPEYYIYGKMDNGHILLIVVIFVCGVIHKAACTAIDILPNCSCNVFSDDTSKSRFGCRCFADSPFTHDSPFETTLLPSNLYSLDLGILSYDWEPQSVSNCQRDETLYSYLSEYVDRIPERTSLELIKFNNFNFEDERLEVMNAWLENVKGSLNHLEFLCGVLKTLPSWALQGFRNLSFLIIKATGLEIIEAGAFSELIPISNPPPHFVLSLEHNEMVSFDFALLEPVASALTDLWMANNSLNNLEVSRHVAFPKLQTVFFQYNRLKKLPEAVISTWPLSGNLYVHLQGNPLCVEDSLCRCCSLLPLMNFHNRSDARTRIDCGDPESKRVINATDIKRIGNIPLCINEFYSDYVGIGEFAEAVYPSVYERCNETRNPDAMACEVRREGV